jgi:hypothetical protein
MPQELIQLLRWFPKYLKISPKRSWTQSLCGSPQSGSDDQLYFIESDLRITPDMLREILGQARKLSIIGNTYFGSGFVYVKFEGNEMGALTRESWEYRNGSEKDIGIINECYRPRLRAYDLNGVYSRISLYYRDIINARIKLTQLIEASGNLVR